MSVIKQEVTKTVSTEVKVTNIRATLELTAAELTLLAALAQHFHYVSGTAEGASASLSAKVESLYEEAQPGQTSATSLGLGLRSITIYDDSDTRRMRETIQKASNELADIPPVPVAPAPKSFDVQVAGANVRVRDIGGSIEAILVDDRGPLSSGYLFRLDGDSGNLRVFPGVRSTGTGRLKFTSMAAQVSRRLEVTN